MKQIVLIADLFQEDLTGGAELNDSVLIRFLESKGLEVLKFRSNKIKDEEILENDFFIVSNFVGLSERHKILLQMKKYIIYEHDHKYISTRDPSKFINFDIPEDKIINRKFYQNAHKVVVLSQICKQIMEKALDIENVISIGTSLWSKEKLSFIEELASIEKTKDYCIINSPNPIKGTQEAKNFADSKNLHSELIGPLPPYELLSEMAQYKNFIFVPKVLETLSRIVVEAKMLGCNVFTNKKLIGAAYEDWYSLQGIELVNVIRLKVNQALDNFYKIITSLQNSDKKKDNKVSKKLNFVTYNCLINDSIELSKKIPKNKYDAVVPVFRSGAIPAFIIAEKLNIPFLIDSKIIGGNRINKSNTINNILLVDDSVSSGRSMIEKIKELKNVNVDCACIYKSHFDFHFLNYYHKTISFPRMFEWNMFNNSNLDKVMFDLDGVICIDPRVYDDDGETYANEIANIPELFIPKYKIHSICTNRISRWKRITEKWLQKNNVKFGNLIMQEFPTAVERRKKSNAAAYKARHYSNSDAELFVESSKWQAESIHKITKKAVYCIENNHLYELGK
jgi:uncharacterized HAD superfamily protein/adenine/guanine phosphoribosyltransferase-like PRPP-binding protein